MTTTDQALSELRGKLMSTPKPDQTSELVFITPEMAETELREHNHMNRDINMNEVESLVRIIHAGKWMSNGETVTYDIDGQIVNGQHRYAAIGKAGKGQWLWIIRGLDPQTRPTVDDHRKRTFRDDLSMNDIKGGTVIEQVCRKVLLWQTFGGIALIGGRRVMRLTLADMYREHSTDVNNAITAVREFPRVPLSMGNRAFLWWLLSQYAPEDTVKRYFRVMSIGSLEPEDGVLVRLRDKMMRDRANRMNDPNSGRVIGPDHIYFCIRAWNAWLTGEKLGSFNRPAGGIRNPYPTPFKVES